MRRIWVALRGRDLVALAVFFVVAVPLYWYGLLGRYPSYVSFRMSSDRHSSAILEYGSSRVDGYMVIWVGPDGQYRAWHVVDAYTRAGCDRLCFAAERTALVLGPNPERCAQGPLPAWRWIFRSDGTASCAGRSCGASLFSNGEDMDPSALDAETRAGAVECIGGSAVHESIDLVDGLQLATAVRRRAVVRVLLELPVPLS
jgi:hypothetical protein